MSEVRRNEQITQLIDNEKIPLLPFELRAAKDALEHYQERQRQLGAAMGGAMGESSETFHDNAPAEAIANDAHINTTLARAVMDTISNVYEFDFDPASDVVTIGSIVSLRLGSSVEAEKYMLTGGTRELSKELLEDRGVFEDVESVTLKSPLGQAIFDKKVGETSAMNINGRMVQIEIIAIN